MPQIPLLHETGGPVYGPQYPFHRENPSSRQTSTKTTKPTEPKKAQHVLDQSCDGNGRREFTAWRVILES